MLKVALPHTTPTHLELLLSLQVEDLQSARRLESDDGSLRIHYGRVGRNGLLVNALGVDIDDVELNGIVDSEEVCHNRRAVGGRGCTWFCSGSRMQMRLSDSKVQLAKLMMEGLIPSVVSCRQGPRVRLTRN